MGVTGTCEMQIVRSAVPWSFGTPDSERLFVPFVISVVDSESGGSSAIEYVIVAFIADTVVAHRMGHEDNLGYFS